MANLRSVIVQTNAAPPPPRPIVVERHSYVPTCLTEAFIVPLLKNYITDYLNKYANSANEGDLALDVGCGRQPFRQHIEALGYEYVSMDAQQSTEGNVDFVSPIDAPLPLPLVNRGPFKLIVCTETLEHVADWTTAFENIASLLGSGGRLLITCPHLYVSHEAPYDFWRPTPYALQHFARTVGFRVVAMEQAGGGWEPLGTFLTGITVAGGTTFRGRVAAVLARFCKNYLLKLALSPNARNEITLRSSIYLSNVAMFEKP